MAFREYGHYDGLGLAELVKKKEVLPVELLEEAIQRVENKNPQLNAVIYKLYEKAAKAAEDGVGSEGAFAGVPMLLKDITQDIKGEPITAGSKSMQSYRANQDSCYVRKVRETGALFLGQTNVPEFALMGITENAYYGATRNPWNINHTPGGSSGGSAAAVAAGMVPIAGANDGGGSIRIPAAYCGLFGLKPTRGRTPVGPVVGRNWQGASVDHILSRSVRDSAAMLDVLSVQEKAAAFKAPIFEGSYREQIARPLEGGLRIAFSVTSPIGTAVDRECQAAVLNTVKLLEELGHHVEEVDAPVDGKRLANSYMTMYFGEVAAALSGLEPILGRKARFGDVEPTTWLLGILGKATSAEEFVLALREWDVAAIQMEDFHGTYDFYITPATASLPAKIGELQPRSLEKLAINLVGRTGFGSILKKAGVVEQIVEQNLARTPFTQLANLTGQPAMSLPMHVSENGLPCGVQVMAARGREDMLFRLAGELELTDNWIKELPC